MHKLKSDIIHALQSVPMSTDKLVEVSNICDAYAKLVEENGSSHNKQSTPLPSCISCGNNKCSMQAGSCSNWRPRM